MALSLSEWSQGVWLQASAQVLQSGNINLPLCDKEEQGETDLEVEALCI
jgi:hypothetical protein